MPEPTEDAQLDGFLEIRKPGAHLEEGAVTDDFVLALGVDLTNFPKFSRVDDDVTYPKADLDIRQKVDVDSGAELPDYSGAYRADLRRPTSPCDRPRSRRPSVGSKSGPSRRNDLRTGRAGRADPAASAHRRRIARALRSSAGWAGRRCR